METDNFRANAKWVVSAEPIVCITGDEFRKSEIDLVTQVTEFFNSIGGKVYREGLGDENVRERF